MVDKIRKQQIIGTICTLIVSSCLLSAPMAQAGPFQRTASGWLNSTDVDVDVNGNTLAVLNTFGTGTFGKSASNQVTELGAFNMEFCVFDPMNDIFIIRLPILARSSIIRFESGDLLFSVMEPFDPTSINFLCFDVNSGAGTAEIPMVITGGTGKFAGATGTLLISQNSTVVLEEDEFPVHIAITEVIDGEIFLSH